MTTPQRIILAALSDTHAGHKLALMNPTVTLYDEGENGQLVPHPPTPTKSQEHLWSLYLACQRKVSLLSAGDPVVVIHTGDVAHGNKFPSELVSTRLADQIMIAQANMNPWLELENLLSMWFAMGTEAHVFGEGSAEILVADGLKKQYPNRDINVCHQGFLTIGSITIDFSHHGASTGSRSWLSGDEVRRNLRDLMMSEIMAGNTPPAIYLRGHYHNWAMETLTLSIANKDYTSTMLILPSFDMMSEHSRKVTKSKPWIINGLAAIEIEEGKLPKIHRLTQTLDIRTKVVL